MTRCNYERYSLCILFFIVISFATGVFADGNKVDWDILKAKTLDDLKLYLDTNNTYQISIGISLMSVKFPNESAVLLLQLWKKQDNLIKSELLDQPLIRVSLASALVRTKMYPERKVDFENYVYSQLSSIDDQVKSNAIVDLSVFKDIKATNRLLNISTNEPDYIIEAIRGLCNIYIDPTITEEIKLKIENRLTGISNGQATLSEKYPISYIKNEAEECLKQVKNNSLNSQQIDKAD